MPNCVANPSVVSTNPLRERPLSGRLILRGRRLRYPADEMVLEAVANGHAAAIVTFNQRDFDAVPLQLVIERGRSFTPGELEPALKTAGAPHRRF